MRKEALLQKWKKEKEKLEIRKKRFEIWEKEADNTSPFTEQVRDKSRLYYSKQNQLEIRIEAIERKIFEIERQKVLEKEICSVRKKISVFAEIFSY